MTTETTPNDTTADTADTAQTTALGDAAASDTTTQDPKLDSVEPQADEPKPDDQAPTGAPETYDTASWTLPEGVAFDQEGFDAVEPVIRELGLDNDQAGKLMGTYAEKIVPMIEQRAAKQMDDAAQELSANLARDLQADTEVGGAKLKEAQAHAAKAIASAIPDGTARAEFSQFLNESGLGNHPLLTRVLAHAGRALGEASTPAAGQTSAPQTESQKFYGR